MHEVTLSLHELFYSSIRQLGKTANANDILAFTHCTSICILTHCPPFHDAGKTDDLGKTWSWVRPQSVFLCVKTHSALFFG